MTYPSVEDELRPIDEAPTAVLERLADRGVLAEEFEAKVYSCRDCEAVGMQFATACPDCGSIHATATDVVRHRACGDPIGTADDLDAVPGGSGEATADEAAAGEDAGGEDDDEADAGEEDATDGADADEDGADEDEADAAEDDGLRTDGATVEAGSGRPYCAQCDAEPGPRELETDHRYDCHECDARFAEPAHRLWCRDCGRVRDPGDARESPLYRYRLTPAGDRWLDRQLSARRSLVAALDERGFEVTVDETVTAAGEEIPVHAHATEELLGRRLVAAVHEWPRPGDVRRLAAAASAVDARPVLVTTDGSIAGDVADDVRETGVTVLDASDDRLDRAYEIHEEPEPDGPPGPVAAIVDRARSMFQPQPSRRSP